MALYKQLFVCPDPGDLEDDRACVICPHRELHSYRKEDREDFGCGDAAGCPACIPCGFTLTEKALKKLKDKGI